MTLILAHVEDLVLYNAGGRLYCIRLSADDSCWGLHIVIECSHICTQKNTGEGWIFVLLSPNRMGQLVLILYRTLQNVNLFGSIFQGRLPCRL